MPRKWLLAFTLTVALTGLAERAEASAPPSSPPPDDRAGGAAAGGCPQAWALTGVVVGPAAGNETGTGTLIMPEVIPLDDGTYRMYYNRNGSGANDIRYADSPDGLAWTVKGTALAGSANPADREFIVSGASVVRLPDGRFRMYYAASPQPVSGASPAYHLRSAVSTDGAVFAKESGVRIEIVPYEPSSGFKLAGHGSFYALPGGGWAGIFSANTVEDTGPSDLFLATSPDGLTWGGYQLLYPQCHDPVVVRQGDRFRVYAACLKEWIGAADAADGLAWPAELEPVTLLDEYRTLLTPDAGVGDMGALVDPAGRLSLYSNYGNPCLNLVRYDYFPDQDGNARLDDADEALVAGVLAGGSGVSCGEPFGADADQDGRVDILDLCRVQRVRAGNPVPGPVFTQQPAGRVILEGSSWTLTCAATGTGTVHYQWRKNNLALAGAQSASYTITGATTDKAGRYDVVATDDTGVTVSAVARVRVESTSGPWTGSLVKRTGPDGVTWGVPVTVVPNAGVPNLLQLPGGDLLMAFQWFPYDDPDHFDRVAVSRSADGGATWSVPAPIEVADFPGNYMRPFDPTLALTDTGGVRIYFTSNPGDFTKNGIYSALSEDGVHYAWEPGARFYPDHPTVDCAVAPWNGRWRILSHTGTPAGGAYQGVSDDGLAFTRLADVPGTAGVNWIGNLVPLGATLRFYGSSTSGLWYADSADGVTWPAPASLGINGGDPAVVRLGVTSWLLVCVGQP